MPRTASIHRVTGETDVRVDLNLDPEPGAEDTRIETGVGFLDHMLVLLARHAAAELRVSAKGDLHVDAHHTVEDVGLALGQALIQALGDKRGIRRYGDVRVPMDETLCEATIDLSGRPTYRGRATFGAERVGEMPCELVHEFFKSLANEAKLTLHLNVPYGENAHHVAEAMFKAFARALRTAVEADPRQPGIPSTKGTL